MSKLKEFRHLEQVLKLQQEKLHALAHDEQLGRDFEFEKKLIALLKRYRLEMHDLQDFIPPVAQAPALAVREKPARYKTDKSKEKGTKKTDDARPER